MGRIGRVVRGIPRAVWIAFAAGVVCFAWATWLTWSMVTVKGTEAFHLPVDLSTAGVYRVTVRESHPDASYRDFYLRTDPKFHSSGDLTNAMKGGRAVLRVTDEGGKELFSQDVQGVFRGPVEGYVLADRVPLHGVGRYAVEMNVTEGAAGLAGRKQEVVGVYEYWSQDVMPAAFVIVAGVGCWLAAGIGAIATWVRVRRGARRTP